MDSLQKPFLNSRKVYVPGKLFPEIRVAMREVSIEDPLYPLVPLYDTSGPYSDLDVKIAVRKGLSRFREKWILDRGDCELLDDISSAYGRARRENTELSHLRFESRHKPLRAKKGKAITQVQYAMKGIITPEMEYVAIS